MKDLLEQNVEEKYYLSNKMIEGFIKHNENHNAKGTGFIFQPTDGGGVRKVFKSECGTCSNG